MIVRIVKMQFEPSLVPDFLELFERTREQIRNFEGCEHLTLYRDINNPGQLFTYSYWKDADSLERYRQSELFAVTWAATKAMFNGKPEAWSLEVESVMV